MFLPSRTNDIVLLGGAKFMVNKVQLTTKGALLELYPVKAIPRIVHASEVKLADGNEIIRRAKAVGVEALKSTDVLGSDFEAEMSVVPVTDDNLVQLSLPDNITDEQKETLLRAMTKVMAEVLV